MQKPLLAAATAAALALAAPAALAGGGVRLDLGGYFKGYLGYADQDENGAGGAETDDIGYLQDSEIHFTGETVLDNGLTVGAHFEANTDRGDADSNMEESFVYLSGSWGRAQLGADDGAAYLLQVTVPSADENYDGIRQTVNPFSYGSGVVPASLAGRASWDYSQNPTGYTEKLTYLSPSFAGLQVGATYAPDVEPSDADRSYGFPLDGDGTLGAGYEGALRYEGEIGEVGFALGAGYSLVEVEDGAGAGTDDRDVWNVALDLGFRGFGLGAAYKSDDQEHLGADRGRDTVVVGADYTVGPYRFGASWFSEEEEMSASTNLETNRYTGGAVYEYGPGLTFRGSLSYVDHDTPGAEEDIDGLALLLGTQVTF